tara:strand:- start:1437 stop:1688 length:252 start_codon:yes stop_codon:yes gene_type:complete
LNIKKFRKKNNNIIMKIDNYIPSNEEIKTMMIERGKDLKERGREHNVFDYSGKPTTLVKATIWHKDGKYVKPESSEKLNCCIC